MKAFSILSSLLTLASANILQGRQADDQFSVPTQFGAIGGNGSGLITNTGSGTTTKNIDQLFEAAGRQANVSSPVTFDLSSSNGNRDNTTGWTWRVNITDVAIPESYYPGTNQSLRAVNEQWELQWSAGGSLSSLLKEQSGFDTNSSACLKATRYRMPANVTRKYSASDNGNCSAVLGDACAQRLRSVSCDDSFVRIANSDDCASTLGVGKEYSYTQCQSHILISQTLKDED